MSTKVTIQDIANELQLSRNTVSKAINNTGVLADATREKILRKDTSNFPTFRYLMGTATPGMLPFSPSISGKLPY